MADDLLARITAAKRSAVEEAARRLPRTQLERMAAARPAPRPFAAALSRPGPSGVNCVAEIKRASPSRGLLREDLDPARLARAYEAGGAAALSVLTEERFFRGSTRDLLAARAATALPVLRKDFLFCEWQLLESAALGADAVLLIARILEKQELSALLRLASSLGMAALVEVFSAEDLEAAAEAGAVLIGINNRDLATFTVDPGHTLRLLPRLRRGQIPLAASGIRSRADIERGLAHGVFNFLIGESLVVAEDPVRRLRELRGEGEDGRS
ncbi:MAG: indole-3-glycerol phosphate synthase TrpC [Desulfobacterales bacterium]